MDAQHDQSKIGGMADVEENCTTQAIEVGKIADGKAARFPERQLRTDVPALSMSLEMLGGSCMGPVHVWNGAAIRQPWRRERYRTTISRPSVI